jgi:NFACT N-terminal and middle domains/NFACT protein RNA binding domain
MDAVTLDHLLDELAAWLRGRHLHRPRLASSTAVSFEVAGARGRCLWLDAGAGTAGPYALAREVARDLGSGRQPLVSGRSRQALLHLRKHVDGARVIEMGRVAGERTVWIETSGGTLVLRLSGPAPALTLSREGGALATVGQGREAWPLPAPRPECEWSRLDPADFEAGVAAARAEGRSLPRAVLAVCPGLGPFLARETDGTARSFAALTGRLRTPRPTLVAPGPVESWHDAELAAPGAVVLVPVAAEGEEGRALHFDSWPALFLEARHRGLAFDRRRRNLLAETRRGRRRLEQLSLNLRADLARLDDAPSLRREAEALLASAPLLGAGANEVKVPDPYEPDRFFTLGVDPRLSGVGNAERRFERARRAERARRQIELRLRETSAALDVAQRREAALLAARDARDLGSPEADPSAAEGDEAPRSPRHYLTSSGLDVLVGRSARENQHLTFGVARPEDLWFHARDVPGAHVILRDAEGRAGALDLREAAEVAAFYSEARHEAQIDVHATRRKHVRPARGGPGRVYVSHSETLRVVPRDPEGRLRKRY